MMLDGMSTSAPPVDRRSPAAGARGVLRELDALVQEWIQFDDGTPQQAINVQLQVGAQLDASGITAADLAEEIRLLHRADGGLHDRVAMGLWLMAACAYAIEAIKFHKRGLTVDAWCSAGDAKYWLGAAAGAWSIVKTDPEHAKVVARNAISAIQAQRAAKPRPKKAPTHRSVFIDAMRIARREGQAFDAFMAAAAVGSIEGLKIKRLKCRGVKRWIVTADAVPSEKADGDELDEKDDDEEMEGKHKSEATFKSWWTAADPDTE